MNDQSSDHKGIQRPALLLLLFLTFLNMLKLRGTGRCSATSRKQVHEDLEISYEMIGLLTGFWLSCSFIRSWGSSSAPWRIVGIDRA